MLWQIEANLILVVDDIIHSLASKKFFANITQF